MSTQTAIQTMRAVVLDSVHVDIHGMFAADANEAALALSFGTSKVCGLSAGFHGSTKDMRRLAKELIRHADITDAARAVAMAAQAQGADA
jgi:hypothetical protein